MTDDNTLISVFFDVVVVEVLLVTVLEVVVERDADNCLLAVSFNSFSASGPLVIVFVSGTRAFSRPVVGLGFGSACFEVVFVAVGFVVAVVAEVLWGKNKILQ